MIMDVDASEGLNQTQDNASDDASRPEDCTRRLHANGIMVLSVISI